ncbi:MAG TPA: C45 family peptidase [Planctomycetota bacterium]|nr:C45 family peptidase [Planctomycetota bacterium]
MPRTRLLRVLFSLLLIQSCVLFAEDAQDPASKFVAAIDPLLDVLSGKATTYTVSADFSFGASTGHAELGRAGDRDYWLSVKAGKDIDGLLSVTAAETRLEVIPKNVAFVGKGDAGAEAIKPGELLAQAEKLIYSGAIDPFALLQSGSRDGLGAMLGIAADVQLGSVIDGAREFTLAVDKKSAPISFKIKNDPAAPWQAEIRMAGGTKDAPVENVVKLQISKKAERTDRLKAGQQTEIAVPRPELERSIYRGGMRELEIQIDDRRSRAPANRVVNDIPGARLEIDHGQRVLYLTGTPAQIGRAHGQLMRPEIRKMMDSTLYVVGLYYSIGKGKWFLNDIRDAWKRLEPFVDKDYLAELDACAEGAGLDKEEAHLGNVFPELFHCSGFAIANEATAGGKLFHGRVLDYMTEIGLQHAQVDFVTRSPGRHATVNIGYAGFIGCVTGMSDAQISMGEMGGRGEGNWDGTPMAFLMRRVLEHADNLEQAREILEKAKRTCEYYYIIADGKSRSAYGVAAWPDKIQFLKQGEAHALLPTALQGCVLLSAGKRYEDLSQRAKDGFGKIDEEGAIKLMSRPVSMQSNLHSVLFVPEDQTYQSAHASLRGHKPASETKYVKHDFKAQVKVLDELEAKK